MPDTLPLDGPMNFDNRLEEFQQERQAEAKFFMFRDEPIHLVAYQMADEKTLASMTMNAEGEISMRPPEGSENNVLTWMKDSLRQIIDPADFDKLCDLLWGPDHDPIPQEMLMEIITWSAGQLNPDPT